MVTDRATRSDQGRRAFLADGGKMGELIRQWTGPELRWSAKTWPQSLRTTLNLCLASNFPLCFIWVPTRADL